MCFDYDANRSNSSERYDDKRRYSPDNYEYSDREIRRDRSRSRRKRGRSRSRESNHLVKYGRSSSRKRSIEGNDVQSPNSERFDKLLEQIPTAEELEDEIALVVAETIKKRVDDEGLLTCKWHLIFSSSSTVSAQR